MGHLASSGALYGATVVVTRARSQSHELCELIASLGGTPLPIPSIQIETLALSLEQCRLLTSEGESRRLARPQTFIFTSANAVRSLHRSMRNHALTIDANPPCIAIGSGTAQALRQLGLDAQLPEKSDSETLAQLPTVAEGAGSKLVIVRGEGGRDILGSLLRSRGWQVSELISYRRTKPEQDISPDLVSWRNAERVVVTFMSGDTARNLVEMFQSLRANEVDLLFQTPAAVISERVQSVVELLGWRAPVAVSRTTSIHALTEAAVIALQETT